MPPQDPAEADRSSRFEAHEYLDGLAGSNNEIGYEEDYEEDRDPVPAQPAMQTLGNLGMLGNLGKTLVTLPSPDPSRRAPGFHFSKTHWRLYRARYENLNEEIQRVIDKVGVATQWLFDETFAGSIVPFVMHANKGGDWGPTTRNDWLMPLMERRRRRIQTCRLVPGHPAWPDGSHWIFINADELKKAIESYQQPTGLISAPEAAEPVPALAVAEIPALITASARRIARETKSGNVDAALRASFGNDYRDTARPDDWQRILGALADWQKANKGRKFPSDQDWRREVYRLWPDHP